MFVKGCQPQISWKVTKKRKEKKEKKKDTPIYLSICTISFAQDLNFTPSYPEECCDLAQVKQRWGLINGALQRLHGGLGFWMFYLIFCVDTINLCRILT